MKRGTYNATQDVYLQINQGGGIIGFKTGDGVVANTGTRMLIRGSTGEAGGLTGRIGMGNNLPANFMPQDRLHLDHTDNSNVQIRFSNQVTGNTLTDGASVGIVQGVGEFRISHFEDQAIRFFIPPAGVPGTIRSAFYIRPGGRTYVGWNTPVAAQINRFTIDADPSDATRSGLRFVDINENSTYDQMTSKGMLSLDLQGNVVWVPTPPSGGATAANNGLSVYTNLSTGVQSNVLGQDVGDPLYPAQLLRHREIPMNGGYVAFSNDGLGGVFVNPVNRVGIGMSAIPSGKLHVNVDPLDQSGTAVLVDQQYVDVTGTVKGMEINAKSTANVQNGGDVNVAGGTSHNYGFDIDVNGSAGGTSHGVNAIVHDSPNGNTGIYAEGKGGNGTNNNYGVSGYAEGGANNYGVHGQAPVAANSWAGYFTGNVNMTDNLTVVGTAQITTGNFSKLYANYANLAGTVFSSDQRLKTNVQTINNACNRLAQLQARSYFFDTLLQSGYQFSSKQQYGFVAQEVLPFFPELVSQQASPSWIDSTGMVQPSANTYLALNYNGFIGLLTACQQEQMQQIQRVTTQLDSTRNELNQLKTCVLNLCAASQQGFQQHDPTMQNKIKTAVEVHLTDKPVVILSQNAPNPFAESTLITYFIPAGIKVAEIQFTNSNGIVLDKVQINDRGHGELRVFAQDLSSGTYTYSLFADGQLVVTQKMVKE